MKIIYGQDNNNFSNELLNDISLECGVSLDTAYLLCCRKIDSVEKAKRFLSPSKRNFISPFLLDGVVDAVNRIKVAKETGEKVVIFGDYDADGICATTILFNVLTEYGINPSLIIPERDNGYGLNLELINKENSNGKIDLLISVDCGISDFEVVEQIKALGIDVIVTDHHEPPETLPKCITINPKIKGQKYSFNGLCGAGVAYKLGYALIGEKANEQLDFVALATVSDSMDLVEENRDLVFEGLKLFNNGKLRPCFRYLISDNAKQLTAQNLAFMIAPKINAGGRMGDANCSLKLFTAKSESQIYQLSVKLTEYNVNRQAECEEIYKQAKAQILEQKLYNDNVILVENERWKTGFVGIVCARLVEEFNKPVIVFAGQNGMLKGSCRSIEPVNIYESLKGVKDLLEGFGGHSQAAGVTVKIENYKNLRKAINEFVAKTYKVVEGEKSIYVDLKLDKPMTMEFAKELELLEPFGTSNKKPIFSMQAKDIQANPIKIGSPHISFRVNQMEMLYFNGVLELDLINSPLNKTVVFEYNLSTFKGKEYLKGYVKQVLASYDNILDYNLGLFSRQLDGNFIDNQVEIIEDLTNIKKYGDLLVLTNVENFLWAKNKFNLPINVFYIDVKDCSSRIVICPKEIPSGYDRVIYLDRPISYHLTKAKSYQYNKLKAIFSDIDCDRETFKQIFAITKTLVNTRVNGIIDCYNLVKDQIKYDGLQFVFSLKVFFELGFFYIENGILKQDFSAKKPLTDSKIYNQISKLRG